MKRSPSWRFVCAVLIWALWQTVNRGCDIIHGWNYIIREGQIYRIQIGIWIHKLFTIRGWRYAWNCKMRGPATFDHQHCSLACSLLVQSCFSMSSSLNLNSWFSWFSLQLSCCCCCHITNSKSFCFNLTEAMFDSFGEIAEGSRVSKIDTSSFKMSRSLCRTLFTLLTKHYIPQILHRRWQSCWISRPELQR